MNNEVEHIKEHWKQQWKMMIAGSSLGFGTIIVNLFYLLATNRLPSFAEGEIFEIIVFAIPLFVFLWFLRVGVWEYQEIKDLSKKKQERLSS